MGLMDKVKGLVGKHPDKANEATEKAGDAVDDRTGGKLEDQVDKAQDAARDQIDGGEQPPPQ